MLGTKRHTFRNIAGHAKNVSDLSSLSAWTAEQFDPGLSWDDVARIKDMWGGPLILKGIMEPEDAIMAARFGADAMVISNHGGRQLDGAPSSIASLTDCVQASQAENSNCEVWLDSGIRSGQDVLKAIALGAKGTMIGRSFCTAWVLMVKMVCVVRWRLSIKNVMSRWHFVVIPISVR